ncbi:flagellar protein FlaG [Paracandidimonas soli]|uniref:Flagellar protein FlaG n=1 Tax=Paracandidimonas soli TaxID=1917182 RepID=A0A4R3V713_9BURK|nr:flagellar protein FlaG [Paracandidimonas soli]TCV00836.1 flagellar protein FlaG [Paracandidimonas soli]
MVQPLAIGPAAFAGNPAVPETGHPFVAPDSAISVPPTVETTNSNPTAGNRNGSSQEQSGNQSLDKTIEQLNSEMQAWSTGMRFEIDDDAQRVVISIIDSASGEVIRTVPSDAVLRIAKMIVQFQGNTVDTQA